MKQPSNKKNIDLIGAEDIKKYLNYKKTSSTLKTFKTKNNFIVLVDELIKGGRLSSDRKKIRNINLLIGLIQSVDSLIDEQANKENKVFHVSKILSAFSEVDLNDREKIVTKKYFKDLENLFLLENTLTDEVFNDAIFNKMLQLRNCDFFLYMSLIPVSKKSENFFRYYAKADLLIDDFVDLYEDLDNNSFNFVAWKAGVYSRDKAFSIKQALKVINRKKVYEHLCLKAESFLKEGLKYARGDAYLTFIAEAELMSLKLFKKNNYFIEFEGDDLNTASEIRTFFLKPHPWETIEQVCNY